MSDVIQENVHRVLTGELDAATAAGEIVSQLAEIMAE
jgi:hypothetical protein